MIESQPARSKFVPIISASVIFAALVAGGGVYAYEKKRNETNQVYLQSQIDSLKVQVSAKNAPATSPLTGATPLAVSSSKPALAPDQTADWKTYTDASTGLSFKYPDTLTPNAVLQTKGVGLSLYVSVQAMNVIPDAPLWYGPDAAKAEMAALAKGDLSQTQNADKLLVLSGGAVGATNLVFSELSCDSVVFIREAHIYRNNYQILIGLNDQDVATIKANNPHYFATSGECLGNNSTEQVWANSGNGTSRFATDVAAGKTDEESQKWYRMFQQILSTVTFS